MSNIWEGKMVLVTGGAGFIGSHVVELLLDLGAKVRVVDNLENGNLENLSGVRERIEFMHTDLKELASCRRACEDASIILHLAAKVGGISYNQKHPSEMFHKNIVLNSNILRAASEIHPERILIVSSACVYPRECIIPTPESEGVSGVPEPTNEGYGWAKRMVELEAALYHREYGLNIAVARPYNTYGPRDHFDEDKGHVIPSLIKRIFNGEDPVRVWGDGTQSRAFLYVEDLARGLVLLTERYPKADPVNIGTSEEVTIQQLVSLLLGTCEVKRNVVFDPSKPTGQPRRNCDTRKMESLVGFRAQIPLPDGLRRTVEWYKQWHWRSGV